MVEHLAVNQGVVGSSPTGGAKNTPIGVFCVQSRMSATIYVYIANSSNIIIQYMKSVHKNILAVIAGIIVGMIVNMGLIILGSGIVPPPAGVDVSSAESIAASIHLFELQHFIFPFLAHALGTLAGAVLAAKLAATKRSTMAMIVGIFFLLGGIANTFMIPAPVWFITLDLIVAYIPMGWLGGRLRASR